MLILTRKPGEQIYIGDYIVVTVVEIKGNQIRLGIDAPPEFRIFRKEIYDQIQDENRAAALGASESLEGLSEAFSASQGSQGGDTKRRANPLLNMKVGKVGGEGSAGAAPDIVKKKPRGRTPDE